MSGDISTWRFLHDILRGDFHLNPESPLLVRVGLFKHHAAFTLVELLVVVAIMLVMMALLVPAFNGIKGAGGITKASYDIAGTLEQARTYAMANNTYVWVGFFEEDGSKASATPGTSAPEGVGRVVISIVASKDGSRYKEVSPSSSDPKAFGKNDSTNLAELIQLNKLIKLDNIHLAAANTGTGAPASNSPIRPVVPADYQVGSPNFKQHLTFTGTPVDNPTTFTYPLTVNNVVPTNLQYTFVKIIEFNTQGEASKIIENTYSGLGAQPQLEVALQPTHGSSVDPLYAGTNPPKAAVAIQVEGLTGQVKSYRP